MALVSFMFPRLCLSNSIEGESEVMLVKRGRSARVFKSAKMHSDPEPELVSYMTMGRSSNLFEPLSYLYKKLSLSLYSTCKINDKAY